MGNKGMVEIHPDELDALRQQAAEAFPWKTEAARLAKALHKVDPDNKVLQDSIWPEELKNGV